MIRLTKHVLLTLRFYREDAAVRASILETISSEADGEVGARLVGHPGCFHVMGDLVACESVGAGVGDHGGEGLGPFAAPLALRKQKGARGKDAAAVTQANSKRRPMVRAKVLASTRSKVRYIFGPSRAASSNRKGGGI